MRMTVGIVLAKLRDRYLRIDRIHPFFLIGGAASVVPQLEDIGAQQAGIVGFEQGVFIWLLRVPGEKERGGPEVQPADNRGIVQALGFLNQRAEDGHDRAAAQVIPGARFSEGDFEILALDRIQQALIGACGGDQVVRHV